MNRDNAENISNPPESKPIGTVFPYLFFCIFIAGLKILCARFFSSIGKGGVGTVVLLSRQGLFLSKEIGVDLFLIQVSSYIPSITMNVLIVRQSKKLKHSICVKKG